MLDRHVVNVRRWTWPREKGGTDGVIPGSPMLKIIRKAGEAGIRLSSSDFLSDPQAIPRDDLRVLAYLVDGLSSASIAHKMGTSREAAEEAEVRLRSSPHICPDFWERVAFRRAKLARKPRRSRKVAA